MKESCLTDENFKCNLCEKHFRDNVDLTVHMHNIHGSICPDYDKYFDSKTFICTVCKKCFTVEESMNKHIQAVHMLPKKSEPESMEKLEWKIVKPNEDGKIGCLE